MRYRWGFDVGTNSLGWCVLAVGEDGVPNAIEAAGARIFSEGRDAKTNTLKATRRVARSARRRRDRFLQRQLYLLQQLTKARLFPANTDERRELQKLDPLFLRASALEERLEPYEIGRALFHLNQRRGFKSNRKDAESRDGVVKQSIEQLLEQMENAGAKTFGALLWERRKKHLPTRARRRGTTQQDLYEFYPARELLDDEFYQICKAQQQYHPQLLTEDVVGTLHRVIFTQRPLKPQAVGQCAYLSEEVRTCRAMPGFQRYRLYQEVNNLEWSTLDGQRLLRDYPDARDAIMGMLEAPGTSKGVISFSAMHKVLKRFELASGNVRFNFETEKRKGFDGNLTSLWMQKDGCVGAQWHDWPSAQQDAFVAVILDDELDDKAACDSLMEQYGLNKACAMACLKAQAQLPDGTASLSLKACHYLTDKMRDQLLMQPDAVAEVAAEVTDFINPFTRAGKGELLDRLPYYGEALQGHIIPGDGKMPGKGEADDIARRIGAVSNPTVHIALNQIRQVVNELLSVYGRPDSIAIELARELPVGKEGRAKINKEQAENQKYNQKIREKLQGGVFDLHQPSRDDVLKYRLWEELNWSDPCGRKCPFCGKGIGAAQLFTSEFEIEHLLPMSITLDSGRANTTVSCRSCNRTKNNRTPYEAFGLTPEWPDMYQRSQHLPTAKQWRFREDALDIWKRDHSDFLARHLNDTRYIGRIAREYLENICPHNKIDVLTGRLTALLRGHWGLNSIMRDHNQFSEEAPKKKNRDDHRHHAVDAIVIGMTTRSMLQRVSTAANRAEELDLDRLFAKNKNGSSSIDPWEGFRFDAKKIIDSVLVSHKVRKKTQYGGATGGQLHNKSAYGIVSDVDAKGLSEVVIRWPVEKFGSREQIESIRDPDLQAEFLREFDAVVGNQVLDAAVSKQWQQALLDFAKRKHIRSVRRVEKLKIIPVNNSQGKAYKAYKGDSNWGMEIYQYPDGHQKHGQWEGALISTYDAHQKGFRPGQTHRPHPAARLVMRLQINECIEIEENGVQQILRVQKISDGELTLTPVNEANVDARTRDKSFKYIRRTPGVLKKLHARKVHFSPIGRMSYENRGRRRAQ